MNKMMGKVEGHPISPRMGILSEYIADLKADDPQTVTINLKNPAPIVLMMLAQDFAGITKKDTTVAQLTKQGYGAGAFRYKEEVIGSHLIGERNPYYYKPGLPYLDTITWQIITGLPAQWAALMTKKVDWVRASQPTPPDTETAIKGVKGITFYSTAQDCINSVVFNLTRNTPFSDPRVRKAIDLLLNRQVAIEVTYFGHAKEGLLWPADWPLWGTPRAEVLKRPGFNPATKEQDLAEAKRLMDEAGFANGFDTPWDTTEPGTPFVDWIVLELRKIGIRADVNVVASADWDYYMALEKKYTFARETFCWVTSDPDEKFLTYFKTGGSRNTVGYSNAEFDALADRISTETDYTKRLALVRKAEEIVMEDRPWIVLGFRDGALGVWDYVHGAGPGYGIFNENRMDKVWVDK